jgi:hypothetical protein
MTALQITGLVILCLLMVCSLGLDILSMPGNWIVLILGIAAGGVEGFKKINLTIILVLLGLAIFGELLQVLLSYFGTRVGGAGRLASLSALIFGLVGVFALGSWIPVVGALIGAFAGAFLGGFLVEMLTKRKIGRAWRAGIAAMFGRAGSIICKIAVGAAMIVLIIIRLI